MKNAAQAIWFALLSLTLLLGIAMIALDYSTVCSKVDMIFHDPLKLLHFKEKYLSESKFLILKVAISGCAMVAALGLLRWRAPMKRQIETACREVTMGIRVCITSYTSMDTFILRTLIGILVVAFSISLYFAVTTPIFIDEVVTFKDFTKNSIFVSVSYYPQPNNHVMFSLLTNIAYSISPFSPKISIRLINVILSLATNLHFFRLSRKFLSDTASLISTTAFAFLFMNLLYSFQARGYEILLLSTIVVLYAMMQYVRNGGGKKYLVLYSMMSMVGFWTIPSFLYPFSILTGYAVLNLILNRRKDLVLQISMTVLLTGICTVLVYSPVLLISGVKSITGNYYTMPIPRSEVAARLLPHFLSTAQWLVGLPSVYSSLAVVAAALLILIVAVKTGNTVYNWLIVLLLSPPILLLIHSVIPFERTWVFLSIPLAIAIGRGAEKSGVLRRPLTLYPVILLLVIGGTTVFTARHPEFYSRDYCLDELTQHIDISKSSSIVYDSDYDAETFRFALFSQNPTLPYVPMMQLTDSTLIDTFDILLVNKTHPFRTQAVEKHPLFTYTAASKCGSTLYIRAPR